MGLLSVSTCMSPSKTAHSLFLGLQMKTLEAQGGEVPCLRSHRSRGWGGDRDATQDTQQPHTGLQQEASAWGGKET